MGTGSRGGMSPMDMKLDPVAARMQGTPGVDNVAMMPTERLNEAGDGLDGNGRRVLTYSDLRAVQPGDDPRPPSREITLHLTGNMARYMWGFGARCTITYRNIVGASQGWFGVDASGEQRFDGRSPTTRAGQWRTTSANQSDDSRCFFPPT
ncbi:MAG TPA: hypothetical protein VGC87_11305, partial [Pyrinomonadaceae bacterium]